MDPRGDDLVGFKSKHFAVSLESIYLSSVIESINF